MKRRKTVNLVLVIQLSALLVAGVLFRIVSSGQALPALANSSHHSSLLASTMQPMDSSIGYYDSQDGFLRSHHSDASYRGEVNLPDGATIINARGFGLDTDPISEFCFKLERYSLYSNPVYEPVTEWVCSGEYSQDGKIVVNAPIYSDEALVDNEQYSYAIVLALPGPYNPPYQDLGVLRFVIDTTYNVQLPIVQRD